MFDTLLNFFLYSRVFGGNIPSGIVVLQLSFLLGAAKIYSIVFVLVVVVVFPCGARFVFPRRPPPPFPYPRPNTCVCTGMMFCHANDPLMNVCNRLFILVRLPEVRNGTLMKAAYIDLVCQCDWHCCPPDDCHFKHFILRVIVVV